MASFTEKKPRESGTTGTEREDSYQQSNGTLNTSFAPGFNPEIRPLTKNPAKEKCVAPKSARETSSIRIGKEN